MAASGEPRPVQEDAAAQLDLTFPACRSRDADGEAPWDASPLAVRGSPPALHWDDRPVALVEGGRVRAATVAAGRLGLRPGMTAAEAQARCATLEILAWDDVAVDGAITGTTAALLIASPQVTPVAGAPGMWWVGASGNLGIGGEWSLVRTLARVAGLWHPRARVAVASSCVAARAATWGDADVGDVRGVDPSAGDGATPGRRLPPPEGVVIVPPGRCAAYLAPAPLGFVPMDDELRSALHALGLRTVGAFAALESREVERRWGQPGVAAWRLARGDDWRRPVRGGDEATRVVSVELAVPTPTIEPVLVLVRAALDRLLRELGAAGRAPAAVAITLTYDDGRGLLPAGSIPPVTDGSAGSAGAAAVRAHTITREVRLARAVDRVAPLFARCRATLDRWPLPAPVSGVAVTVTASEPLPAAVPAARSRPTWRDPDAVEAALEELRAELGAELGPSVVVRGPDGE